MSRDKLRFVDYAKKIISLVAQEVGHRRPIGAIDADRLHGPDLGLILAFIYVLDLAK